MSIKKSLLVLALLFSLVSFAQSPADKSFPPEELFAPGSYYYPEQWERDLKRMPEMGIKFTHFAEFAWAMMEPEEGKYDFEWPDRAVSLAEKYGLKVIMCTPTPTPPVWLSKKYPDILIQRDNGVSIQHGRRQHASWSSDRYRRYVENIVSRPAMRYGNHPAVIGWQIDNEPGHYGVVDYSENAQIKFRVWLQKKYGTIDKLNDTWGTSFWSETCQNFEQVRLPNQQEVPEKPNPHAMLGLNRFMADVLTPAAGTDVWAVYTDQFYKGAASVIHRRLGKGTVTCIGTDTDDGKLEKEVVRRVYMEAGVPTEDLPYGVVKEWRDGFYNALNYTSDIQEIVIPDEAEVLIGSARLEPAGVVVWKEKSDNKYK